MKSLRIALCYDLKSDYLAAGFAPEDVMEFDEEETIAALEGGLRQLGHHPERVGRGVELARRLAAGERWDLVFNFAEGVRGRSREAQVPAVCEMFDQPYTFSDPLTCAVTLDKSLAKRVEELPEGSEWIFEPKWDGFRALMFRESLTATL